LDLPRFPHLLPHRQRAPARIAPPSHPRHARRPLHLRHVGHGAPRPPRRAAVRRVAGLHQLGRGEPGQGRPRDGHLGRADGVGARRRVPGRHRAVLPLRRRGLGCQRVARHAGGDDHAVAVLRVGRGAQARRADAALAVPDHDAGDAGVRRRLHHPPRVGPHDAPPPADRAPPEHPEDHAGPRAALRRTRCQHLRHGQPRRAGAAAGQVHRAVPDRPRPVVARLVLHPLHPRRPPPPEANPRRPGEPRLQPAPRPRPALLHRPPAPRLLLRPRPRAAPQDLLGVRPLGRRELAGDGHGQLPRVGRRRAVPRHGVPRGRQGRVGDRGCGQVRGAGGGGGARGGAGVGVCQAGGVSRRVGLWIRDYR
ncbi:hypothetical protein DFJ74DRAFT_57792, partial [Hyaloraphidium curvatum]